jgi:hypothetical protein
MIVEMPDHQIINDKSRLALEYDVDDTRLYTRRPAKKTPYQQWQLTLLDDGNYQIRSVKQVLGLKRPGDPGSDICVQDEDASDRGQRWKLEHMRGYLYKVRNVESEQYLEVPYGNTDEKTAQVGQWRTADESHQHWRLIPSLDSQELRHKVEKRGWKHCPSGTVRTASFTCLGAYKMMTWRYIWGENWNWEKPQGRDRFKFQPVDSEGKSITADSEELWHGYYHILAGHSGKTIQAKHGNREAGTPIVQDGTGGQETRNSGGLCRVTRGTITTIMLLIKMAME